jgi:hypothetical protein
VTVQVAARTQRAQKTWLACLGRALGFIREKSAVTLGLERAARHAYVVRCANRRDRLFGISTPAPAAAWGVTVNIPDTEAELSLRGDMPIGPD